MTVKSIASLLIVTLLTLNCFAQPSPKSIEGKIRNSTNEELPGATVRLLTIKDSSLVKAMASDSRGNFMFKNLDNGSYLLQVSSVGYSTLKTTAITIDDTHTNIVLPAIILLTPQGKELKEVVIEAKRPLIEQDIDKTIINVDAMLGSAGYNSYEILEKTPGVAISESGSISLNGKTNVLVLIDGRPTYMSGQDLINYLRSLPGGVVDKLELMDNPSSKYDAAGGAVINIRLKKNRQAGLTGNINADINQGSKFRTNESVNLNYNTRKINWFGNFNYSRGANYGDTHSDRKYLDDNGGLISLLVINNRSDFSNHGYFSRFGLDYTISPKTIVGMQARVQVAPRKESFNLESKAFNDSNNLDSIVSGNSEATAKWKNISLNLNFQHRFSKEGHELTADFNYITYNTTGDQAFNNFVAMPNSAPVPTEIFSYFQVSDVSIYNFKADYIYPLKNKMLFEAGIKSSFSSTDNDFRHYANQDNTPDYSKSNHFLYDENINAAYVNLRKTGKRLGLQSGLRAENTNLKGNQLGNAVVAGSQFKQNFTDLFPTLFISYKLDTVSKNTITISLSRRLSRPGFQSFNPFLAFRDKYSYSSGNPSLKPFYQNRVEIAFQHKQFLNIRIGAGLTKGLIMQTASLVNNILISRPANISTNKQGLFAATLTYTPAKWWSINYSFQALYNEINGVINTEAFRTTNLATRVYLINQFKIDNKWSADFSMYYSGREFADQFLRASKCYFNSSLQRKILKDKGTLTIGGEDMFGTWRNNSYLKGIKHLQVYHEFMFDTQRLRIAFSYRFGDEKFLRKRKHVDNAAEQEAGRAQ